MSNMYFCENCGSEVEIPEKSNDNKLCNVAGVLYIPHCGHCGIIEVKQ